MRLNHSLHGVMGARECVCVWLAIHSSATQPALYLLKAICITLTLNYECLLRESDCLLQMRELLSAILFSRLR